MNKFWSFAVKSEEQRSDLYILDEIASNRSWFGDEVTPKSFKRDLDRAEGTLYVWLDSPGGDAFAGSTIHDMLREYSASGRGKVVAMVSLAASAASIIAMAADEIRISVLGTIMIHKPWSRLSGNSGVLRAVADALDTVADGQVDAYVRRTGQSRETVLELLEGPDGNGTYMNARQAIEMGFADSLMHEEGEDENAKPTAMMRSLTEMRIASCMERSAEQVKAIAEGAVQMTSVELKCHSVGFDELKADANDLLAGMDAARILAALRAAAALEPTHNDLIDAAICGIQAGLAYWDEFHSVGIGPHDEPSDDGRDALAAALDATRESTN